MDFLATLAARNADFVAHGFSPDLKILPSRQTMIVGCVDPRVDPMDVLGLKPGEAVVVRNVGGRVTPALRETLTILRTVAQAAGKEMGDGWNLILLQDQGLLPSCPGASRPIHGRCADRVGAVGDHRSACRSRDRYCQAEG